MTGVIGDIDKVKGALYNILDKLKIVFSIGGYAMKIVLASKNQKKVRELQQIAKEITSKDIEVICLSDIPEIDGYPQAEENGATFLQNARIKAEYWAEILDMPALGEDSGIEIDALGGAPGVYTKRSIAIRCPGEKIDEDKPEELYPKFLELMKKSKNPSKKAHWVSSMVLVMPDTMKRISAINTLTGEMCECKGERQFGFDQYFKPENSTKTLAEMTIEEKNAIGPRKKSFEEILSKI